VRVKDAVAARVLASSLEVLDSAKQTVLLLIGSSGKEQRVRGAPLVAIAKV
jgi:hypothetical protein